MKSHLSHLLLCLCISMFTLGCSVGQMAKPKVETQINEWYAAHPDGYTLVLEGKDAVATLGRYHPDNPKEQDDLLRINYEDMEITLAFDQPFSDIEWSAESLQQHFSYVAIDRIHHEINTRGWEIYPRTPSSSLSGKGVKFTTVTQSDLAFTIDWKTYSVFGYKSSSECDEARSIADGSVPEKCYVSVKKNLPLHIEVKVDAPKQD